MSDHAAFRAAAEFARARADRSGQIIRHMRWDGSHLEIDAIPKRQAKAEAAQPLEFEPRNKRGLIQENLL